MKKLRCASLRSALQRCGALSLALLYLGPLTYRPLSKQGEGYDPHHLGRIAAVDVSGKVLLDTTVRPRAPLLDARQHLTGLTRELLERETSLELDEVRGSVP